MQDNILFFQSTSIGGSAAAPGLVDLFVSQLHAGEASNLFEQLQVAVPNQAMGIWLKDQAARQSGICANVDFIVLLGPLLQKIYLSNNPQFELFDFSQAKFIIYDYLCSQQIECPDAAELNGYLYPESRLDKLRAFQLAGELQQIFHEYLYLRTNELIRLENSKFQNWQKHIWRHLLANIGGQKTFLDVYQYFLALDLKQTGLKLPSRWFIFGLTSIYPSQLAIIKKLAARITIYWYYQTCSYQYYGDLLSSKAKSSLEKRLLRKPDLSLDDLYLTEGNPLLANLGQQSREFIELMHANDIEVYSFNPDHSDTNGGSQTMLQTLQEDIRQIKYRVGQEYRLQSGSKVYCDPLTLGAADAPNLISDLAGGQSSIKINSCHNRMREVQVMFNEVVKLMNLNPACQLSDILICAPDIDDYAPYLHAVFANEQAISLDGRCFNLPYNITGNRQQKSQKIIETLKLIINTPYHLPVNYFIELLMQAELQHNLKISANDVILVKKWLADNAIHYGYSGLDYQLYGYVDYPVHSFKQFLINLTLGACLSEAVFANPAQLPLYSGPAGNFIPYDNIDNNQIALANKLIALVEELESLRMVWYLDHDNLREVSVAEVQQVLNRLQERLIFDDESRLNCSRFIGSLSAVDQQLTISLPILNLIFDDYLNNVSAKFSLNGRITCASMQYMRNLPYQYVYVLGLNFGEFPRNFRPNQLSLLASDWYLADRNYNVEDKQVFLDIILSAGQQLFLSYLGRKETDNSTIKPSPVLGLLIKTLGESFSNFVDGQSGWVLQKYDYKNILCQHSLHPFYNNPQDSYAQIWQKVAAASGDDCHDRRWNFKQISPIVLAQHQQAVFYKLTIKNLAAVFLFSNANLYRVLGLNEYRDQVVLSDKESLSLADRNLARAVYPYFERYTSSVNADDLCDFLVLKGVLGYRQIGAIQFAHYHDLYLFYHRSRGTQSVALSFDYDLKKPGSAETISLTLTDQVWQEGNAIIVLEAFEDIRAQELASKFDDLPYALKIRALLVYLLVSNHAKLNAETKADLVVLVRQLNLAGQKRDFVVSADDPAVLLRRVLSYYVRSLANPVLVHKAAINEYAKASRELFTDGSHKNSPQQCLAKAKAKFLADWQNSDLTRIKQDAIFAQIGENYFEFIAEINGVNDIAQMGLLLAGLKGN